MDSSPLVKAHDHARAAALAHTDSTVAISEHALAAGEFSNAAKSTTSREALRTLKLLEDHHRRLSELLKLPLDRRASGSPPGGVSQEHEDVSEKSPSASVIVPDDTGEKSGAGTLASPPSSRGSAGAPSQHRRYPPSRELSSSIASNLASARGIRSKYRGQPLAPSISSESAPGSVDGAGNKDGTRSKMQNMLDQKGKPSWVPPAQTSSSRVEKREFEQKPEASPASPSSAGEEGYSRFYNTFGSLINRLSAPLAFAGLPLIAEESAPETSAPAEPTPAPRKQQRASKPPPSASADPDLSRIYSKAALRALGREGHGANDSFYFVPATGGTVSYANILSFDQKEKRRIAASVHGGDDGDMIDDVDDDDFADARELHASMSPGVKRRVGRNQSSKDLQNAVEELYLENKGLKEMLDKLSKRLHAFEANAQNTHMALQSSMRLMRPGSPLSSSGSGGRKEAADDALVRKRNKELEDELAMVMKSLDALEQDNVRLRKINGQYRDRWEELKTKAKAKRAGKGSGTEAGGEPST
ncbi:hypothetical protein MAPG_01612 [Magnaporthiopsis poae ATCC 64411]|uniref:Uncharacterized protein n=1 Tax=Magnaporthiopsis poae (strain ATCC 64411 / 73-15) TaxID=644358 RepID=A0A0C4DP58_MAGP6|nr:hypothetical protein MAPG_01612 [Magnaporthiopsis poae ATCC 64411]